eukprot:862118-Rhodomonas_salina.1
MGCPKLDSAAAAQRGSRASDIMMSASLGPVASGFERVIHCKTPRGCHRLGLSLGGIPGTQASGSGSESLST